MRLINIVFLVIFFPYILVAQTKISQISLVNKDSLINKNYKWNMELLLEYIPLGGITEIYSLGISTIQVNKILVDNKLLSYSSTSAYIGRSETEIYIGNSTIRKEIQLLYLPDINCWGLIIMPYGNRDNVKWYDIPEETKEIEIFYNVLFPNHRFSEEQYSKITIR